MAVAAAVLAGMLVLAAACAAPRRTVTEPPRVSRPLTLSVNATSWAAIVETVLAEGDVIRGAVPALTRLSFTRPLTAETLWTFCDVTSTDEVDADSWGFRSGTIDLAVWLDHEPGAEEADLTVEGRCNASFNPPKLRTYLLAPVFLSVPAAIVTGGKVFEPRTLPLRSTGELERQLQQKIVTTLGLEMPRWLVEPR